MPTHVRCHCRGNAACKLCHGTKFYEYQLGPCGWMPFTCPNCEGARFLSSGEARPCFTRQAAGSVDPANPPFAPGWSGMLRTGWKFFFGGG